MSQHGGCENFALLFDFGGNISPESDKIRVTDIVLLSENVNETTRVTAPLCYTAAGFGG